MTEPACPHCLGEGRVFPDDVADWIICRPCRGTGKRADMEELKDD